MDKALAALDQVKLRLTHEEYESIAQHLRKKPEKRLAPHPGLQQRPQQRTKPPQPEMIPIAYPPPCAVMTDEFAPSAPPLPKT